MEKMSPWKTNKNLDWWIKKQVIKNCLQECDKRAMEKEKLCFISQCVSLFPSQKDGLQHCFQSLLTYKMYQKHLMVFETWKPACPLSGASIQTIITYSDVEKERWSVQHHIAAVELFIKRVCYSYTAWFLTAVSQPAWLILQYQTNSLGLCQKQGTWNTSCQNSWPKTANLGAYSTICFPSQM